MLDSTVKGVSSNSYVSVSEAVRYFADRPYGFAFSEEDMFSACLVHATQILDSYVEWYGEKTTPEQRLEWPRADLIVDEDEIPYDIKMATYELAFTIKDTNILSSGSMGDFDSIKVASIGLEISSRISTSILPTHIIKLIDSYSYFSGINCDILRK